MSIERSEPFQFFPSFQDPRSSTAVHYVYPFTYQVLRFRKYLCMSL
jgi:hypothetical protein